MGFVCEQRAWLEQLPRGSYFRPGDMPGASTAAVHTFLSREVSKPRDGAACVRAAPGLYWVPTGQGEAGCPPAREVLAACAGAGWGYAGHAAGCVAGWLTHVTTGTVPVAVVGRPGRISPVRGVRLCGRANERRRMLNPAEVTYLEAVSFFDACPEVDWDEALRITAANAGEHGELRPEALREAVEGERGNGARLLRERVGSLCDVLAGGDPPPSRAPAPPVWPGQPHLLEAVHLPGWMGSGWRGRSGPLRQFVRSWSSRPADREAMCAAAPFGPNRLDLVRIAATVHALCDRDGVEVPEWVWGCRWSEDVCMSERLAIDGGLGSRLRAHGMSACAYHRVWFQSDHITDHRVHGFWKVRESA